VQATPLPEQKGRDAKGIAAVIGAIATLVMAITGLLALFATNENDGSGAVIPGGDGAVLPTVSSSDDADSSSSATSANALSELSTEDVAPRPSSADGDAISSSSSSAIDDSAAPSDDEAGEADNPFSELDPTAISISASSSLPLQFRRRLRPREPPGCLARGLENRAVWSASLVCMLVKTSPVVQTVVFDATG
jgi:hypothetical protein